MNLQLRTELFRVAIIVEERLKKKEKKNKTTVRSREKI